MSSLIKSARIFVISPLPRYALLVLVLLTSAFQLSCPPVESLEGIVTEFDPRAHDHIDSDSFYVQTNIQAIAIDERTGNIFIGGTFSSVDNVRAYNVAMFDRARDGWVALRNVGFTWSDDQVDGYVSEIVVHGRSL